MEGDIGENKNKNLELENLQLIDISSEDDFLIDDSPLLCDVFEGFRLSVVGAADIFGHSKQQILASESFEAYGSRRNGENNMRKSLAWDSAFFTSAGVLDPEELFMINKGCRKTEAHLLPGIQEELKASAESICTSDSSGLSFESLEIDLFKDRGTSNQKSRKASCVASSRCPLGKGAATKKEVTPRNMMKSIPAPRRQSSNSTGSERITRECKARSRESNSSSQKPPKVSSRANPISATPTKRASFGNVASENRMESKKPCLGNSCSVVTHGSSKSYSLCSPTVTSDVFSCSSYEKSGSASSDSTGKLPRNSLRRKIDSCNVNLATSDSLIRTPRCSIRNKLRLESSGNSISKSMPKPLSCISPASSMDCWSSESSSSSSSATANQISKISKGKLYATRKGALSDSHATRKGALFDSHATRKGALFDSHATQASVLKSHPGATISTDVSRHFKPSGLRMPSPNIGHFDAEKSMMSSINEGLQFSSGSHNTFPKSGTEIKNGSGISNRRRHSKLQSATTVVGSGNTKLCSQQSEVPCPALGVRSANNIQFRTTKNATTEMPVSGITQSCPSMALRYDNNLSPEMRSQDCLKAREVGARLHTSSEIGLRISSEMQQENGIERISKNRKSAESIRQVQLKGNNKKFEMNKDGPDHSHDYIHSAKEEHQAGSPHNLANSPRLRYVTGKENVFRYEDHVDGLSRHLASIDLSGEVLLEL